ncbi:MAG TPA: AbrB/MazE/SpoVT family DNA-binding domain-containing protein [Alphaproteobacteria bacterium]|nr:AbrB/MazE/SpoVT family DNA-binding domain-containing protein [Alphaproteobacteria bacterium]
MAITSRLSSKAQTVLPQAVREYLKVGPGDQVEYELRDGCAILRPSRPRPEPAEDPFVHFEEWAGEADEAAYADL